VRVAVAVIALFSFLMFALLALRVSGPVDSGAFVRVCGHVVGVKHLNHGCAYTLVSSGRSYTVLDFYRGCSGFEGNVCILGRPAGGDGNTVYRPLFG